MDIQHTKQLIFDLNNSDVSIRELARNTLIEHAEQIEVLYEFLNILHVGKESERLIVVDLLSDVHTEHSLALLLYALHDTHNFVKVRIIDNLKSTSGIDTIMFWLEATLKYKENDASTAREAALIAIKQYREIEKREYFLPLINNYLKRNPDLDLTVRGDLLSILAKHDVLDGVDNFIDAVKYSDFETKEYALHKLRHVLENDMIKNEVKEKINATLSELFIQEIYPDIRLLLEKYKSNMRRNETVFSFIQSSSDWFAETILYFRKLGFYQQYIHLSDSELIEKIKDSRGYNGEKLTHNTQFLLILAEDQKRVWYCDAETYYEQAYVKLFEEWGLISCGEFLPEDIIETTDVKNNKIIRFILKNKSMEITANNFGDWIDGGIFEEINELMRNSPIQFCTMITNTQEICLISLTASQKTSLQRDLGLKFEACGRYISPPVFI